MGTTRETHIGTVTDIEDPEKRFRLKVACATLMGVDDSGEAVEFGDWIEPTFPVLFSADGEKATGGFFMIPSVGATVEIDIATDSTFDESPGQTSISGGDPKWRASLFQLGDEIPEEFETNYPNRFGFKSATGHLFILDDSEGAKGKVMLAARPNAEGASSFLSIENNGSIQLVTNAGQMLYFNAEKGELTILDASKNMFAMKPDGITMISGTGHTIDMNKAGVNILAAGNLLLQGNSITLKTGPGGFIAIGDELAATDPTNAAVVLGTGPPAFAPSTKVFISKV